jgi:hypothetical protein
MKKIFKIISLSLLIFSRSVASSEDIEALYGSDCDWTLNDRVKLGLESLLPLNLLSENIKKLLDRMLPTSTNQKLVTNHILSSVEKVKEEMKEEAKEEKEKKRKRRKRRKKKEKATKSRQRPAEIETENLIPDFSIFEITETVECPSSDYLAAKKEFGGFLSTKKNFPRIKEEKKENKKEENTKKEKEKLDQPVFSGNSKREQRLIAETENSIPDPVLL